MKFINTFLLINCAMQYPPVTLCCILEMLFLLLSGFSNFLLYDMYMESLMTCLLYSSQCHVPSEQVQCTILFVLSVDRSQLNRLHDYWDFCVYV